MPMCVRHLETFSSSLSKNWSCSSLSSAHQGRVILCPQTNPKHFPGWRLPWGGVDTESFHEGEILELSLLKRERNTKYFFKEEWEIRTESTALFFFYWILKKFTFNCGLIALQCCVSFCCTTTWISRMYTYIPSVLNSPPTHSPSHPSRSSQRTKLSFLLVTGFTHDRLCMSRLLSQFVPHSPSHTIVTPSLFSPSPFPSYRSGHQYHFSRSHMYALISDICFSLSDLFYFVWQTLGSLLLFKAYFMRTAFIYEHRQKNIDLSESR